jgi:ABC-type Zn uptake system ZnuABC Zn-binding protein ZnuA
MRLLRSLGALICLGLSAGMGSCGGGGAAPGPAGKPMAVASVFCYFDALRAIGGEDVDVAILLPPGKSPHDFSATVNDRQTVAKARLLVSNGLGLDDWAPKLGAGSRNLSQLVIGKRIATIENPKDEHEGHDHAAPATAAAPAAKKDDHAGHDHGHDHKHDHAHDHGPTNPHVWLDPTNQIKAAEAIRDALIDVDPAHRGGYTNRAGIYIEELKKLDEEFKAATAKFKHKEFIGFHSAYDYLARRYGLTQVAALQEAGSDSMSVAQVQKVIKIIRDRKVPVLFMETAFDAKKAQPVVDATGVKLGTLQPLETYDKLDDTYVSLMRQNLAELKKGLE